MMNQPELGRTILSLRQRKGLTQVELAERCHLSLRTIQRIESSEVTPRSYTVKTIFSCLDYNHDDSSAHIFHSGSDVPHRGNRPVLLAKVLELFNLKTHTMKKVSVLSLTAVLAVAGLFLAKNGSGSEPVKGWFLTGSSAKSYAIKLDRSVYMSGGSSALLESTENKIDGFGTLMQTSGADEYLGRRVKMTAYVKTKDVSDWACLWLRIDSKQKGQTLGFDNMGDRPLKGSNDWTKCEIILDVPEESGTLNYGVLLSGTGKVWLDHVTFEAIDKKNPATESRNKKPANLDFSE